MEAVAFHKTSPFIYQTMCCHIPDDNNIHQISCNLAWLLIDTLIWYAYKLVWW